jgi:antitoxin component YwqK of YwqJK toxin-antitoxin module
MKKLICNSTKNNSIFLFTLILLSLFITSCNGGKKNVDDFVVKNGLIYLKNSKAPFTGRESGIVKGLKIEYDVLNGIKTGEFKIYYKNGIPQMAGHLVNNKNEGSWKYFYPDSNLESQGNFKNDLPDGKWAWYYQDKKLKETGNFVSGKREGKWLDYDKEGKVVMEKLYKDGIELEPKSVNKAK